MRTLCLALAMTAFWLSPPVLAAADLPPASLAIFDVIDQQIDHVMKANDIKPAAQADDRTIIRRLSLDLIGSIPTLPEVEAYAASTDPQKRGKLVDRLIASPAYSRYQGAQFDVMLGYAGSGRNRGTGALRDYLVGAIAENRPWDRMFREMMLPNESEAKQKGAIEFLKPRIADQDRLTNDVSVNFFGVNVSCAQCHDHPLVKDWTQDHYFGMKSFLARTFEKNGVIGEQPSGVVKFKPNKGPEKTAKMMFLTGTIVEEGNQGSPIEKPKPGKNPPKEKPGDKVAPSAPSFSARAKLVDVALQPENADLIARSIVNRIWHRFLGYGLVAPLDQMHSENPASHPELLEWLARDMATHKYDLNRLVRGVVLSKTYSRSSKTDSESPPGAQYFAVAQLKPLTPLQLATSLKLATQDPATFHGLSPADLDKKIDAAEKSSRGLANLVAQPTDDFQIGVGEALVFSNSDILTREYLAEGKDSLLAKLKSEKDVKAGVELMVKSFLGRAPTPVESEALAAFVTKRSANPTEAYRQAMWALATCPEFRFNY